MVLKAIEDSLIDLMASTGKAFNAKSDQVSNVRGDNRMEIPSINIFVLLLLLLLLLLEDF